MAPDTLAEFDKALDWPDPPVDEAQANTQAMAAAGFNLDDLPEFE